MALPPSQAQNPYHPSAACAAGRGYLPDDQPLLREELEAFAGKNGRVYWDLLQPTSHFRSLFAGFNFAAAAFCFLWLLYRKMYREFVAVMLLVVPTGVAWAFESTNALATALLSITPLGLMATVGILGNGLYLRRACAAVASVRQQEPDPIRRMSLLSARGGTSWFAPLMYIIVHLAFMTIYKGRLFPW